MGARQKRFYQRHRQSELDRNKELAKKYREYCKTSRGRFNKLLKDIRKRAGTNITIEDVKHIFHLAVSMLPNGYTRSNVRLVCWWVNMARNTLPDEEFLEKCRAVVNLL